MSCIKPLFGKTNVQGGPWPFQITIDPDYTEIDVPGSLTVFRLAKNGEKVFELDSSSSQLTVTATIDPLVWDVVVLMTSAEMTSIGVGTFDFQVEVGDSEAPYRTWDGDPLGGQLIVGAGFT